MLSCSPRCWRWWIFVRESCARRMNGAEFRIHCNITSSPLCSSHRARQQPKERACGTIIRISLQIIVSFLTYQHQQWQHKRNVFRKVSFAGSCLSARNLLWFVKIKFVFDSSCLPLLRIWVWCPPRGKVWKVQHACNLAALQTDNLNRWWKEGNNSEIQLLLSIHPPGRATENKSEKLPSSRMMVHYVVGSWF